MAPPGNEHASNAERSETEPDRAPGPSGTKAEWRSHLTRRRAVTPDAARVADAGRLAVTARGLAGSGTVCAYVPFGSEPGSTALLDALAHSGARVLLPVIPSTPGPLEWAEYTGPSSLVPGRLRGVLEPAGPRLGSTAPATADRVLLPALAVDRVGVRLGRGAGYYDRSLAFSPNVELIAVVRDTELVDRLPAEPHDVRMHAALTPGRGLVRLPCSARV
ncbi:5-formyltetrahydrofolate cyclo-ligase [Amycolatopsis antarctica]|uniref:5-formyltetrahydrofolate cyclo-ligase n=1 Tax=Amycolatopsis antarctica TaxID=1854586 RepID=A0A263D4V2_9PSEU|nr:5-formyltetrahydrofolate cyclo-ligase [Amycolatopsis antarctica]OZM73490.1 5-formyltetrahydrofolate cyclo-ligase [Amycolatopsis antarctica]